MFNKEMLYERYIENPEELDGMLRRILTSDAYKYVFKILPKKYSDLDFFEVKFGLALYYINRGFPRADAPAWSSCTTMVGTGFERITYQGVIRIIEYINKLKNKKKRRLYARHVDEDIFLPSSNF